MGYPSPVPRLSRPALPWALVFALALPAAADSPLNRLAVALADEIARTAQGRPVEIGSIEDRTGRGAAFVLDLRNLLLSRLEGRLSTGQYFIFLTRDLATAVGFVVAKIIPTLRPAVFRARMLGKIVTVLQLITLVAIILVPELTQVLVLTIGVVSAASIVDYTIALWRERARSSAA